jgi:hypothetical protein
MSFSVSGTSGALVSLGTATTSGSGAKVLLLADEDGPSTTALANSIAEAGFLVTLRPAPEYTWDGTNPSADGFDLIIHLNGNTIYDGQTLSPAAQTALVAFVQGGGGFVGAQWNSLEALGQQAMMQDLVLTSFPGWWEENCASCVISYTAVPEQQSHPVLAGLPSSFSFNADGHDGGPLVEFASNPPSVLMQLPSGAPGVLVRSFGDGKVVNFSFAPNYGLGGQGKTLLDPNVQLLYINAVRWASRATTTPTAKSPATITIVDPMATFDGTAKAASVVTNPAGLTGLSVTYSLGGIPVTSAVNAGVYQVHASLDHADYEAPQATGTLTILRATPVILWTPPQEITAGTPLGVTELNASVVGVGGVSLAGELIYLPGEGTILPAGTQPLSVEFLTHDGNYTNAIKTVTITVVQAQGGLTFKGFYPPVRNMPVRNRLKAGRAVAVRFSVSGGAEALVEGSPSSRGVPCVNGVPERTIEDGVGARSSRLHYDRRRGEYRYIWKTSSSWAGTCRMLEVRLVDGSTHEALFRFLKSNQKREKKRAGDRRRHDDDD